MSQPTNNEGGDALQELHNAIFASDLESVEALLDDHPDLINAPNVDNDISLHSACWAKQLQIVDLLLSKGADVDAKGCYGRTPLHYAVHEGGKPSVPIVRALLDHGANPTIREENGFSPADWAKIEMVDGLAEVLELLSE